MYRANGLVDARQMTGAREDDDVKLQNVRGGNAGGLQ